MTATNPPQFGPQPWRARSSRPPVRSAAAGVSALRSTPCRWLVEGETTNTQFAAQMAPAGDVNADGFADVLIAEQGFGDGRGRVLAYYGSAQGLPERPSWSACDELISLCGQCRGTAEGIGDLDGDGFDDVVVVSVGFSPETNATPPRRRDRVEIFRGGPMGLAAQPAWTVSAVELSARGIVCAGRAGDLNGETFADLYVLVSTNSPVPTNDYAVCPLYGSATGPRYDPAARLSLFPPSFLERPWVASAGDVNRDGCDDLLVGEPHWSGQAYCDGRALLFPGSRQGLQSQPVWTVTYPLPVEKGVDDAGEQCFGLRVAGAGDVNGDGCADALLSAPWADHGDVNEGLAFGYYGSPNGLSREHRWFTESNHPFACLGLSISGAGDVNGDGFADVIVGAPRASDGQMKEGAAVVFLGLARGLSRLPHWSVLSDNTEQQLGYIVAGAGDVNGDGCDDVLVAAPNFTREGGVVGRVCLYYGSSAGLTGSFNWRLDKPFLTALQERLVRTSGTAKLGAFAALLAALVALAVAWRRALRRALRAERELARQAERTRIARDLHDGLGADLARLQALEPTPAGVAGKLAATVQAALHSAEQAVWAINPANDTLENLFAFLLQQADRQFSGTRIRCLTAAPEMLPDIRLEPEVRKQVFFAVKEALANILKHAQATEARLQIAYAAPLLEIAVEDDGVGLPPGPHRRFGNGVKNLQQRMARVGRQVDFHPRPGGGTRVVFWAKVKG